MKIEYDNNCVPLIGGWLCLLAVGMVLSPIVCIHIVFKVIQGIEEFVKVIDGYNIEIGQLVLWVPFWLCVLMDLLSIFDVIILIILSVYFFKKRKTFIKTFYIHVLINFVVFLIGSVLCFYCNLIPYDEVVNFRTLWSMVLLILWSCYLKFSKRAKYTFVRSKEGKVLEFAPYQYIDTDGTVPPFSIKSDI